MSANQQPNAQATVAYAKEDRKIAPFMQNRELSWLTFDQRVLDQGTDENVPLLERLNFISIFWSNLQEFFMVRVGSLTDLSLVKKQITDSKSGMTPNEQLDAIYARCHQLYPLQEKAFADVNEKLSQSGITYVPVSQLDDEQRSFLDTYAQVNVFPFLAPQIINSRHPFPHLENGAIYVVVRLDETAQEAAIKANDKADKKDKKKKGGAEGATLGLIPMPRQCRRVIELPGEGFCYTLLEQVVELYADKVFDMYPVKHTNIICVTRNADMDTAESADEEADDYREHMKRILKKRGRLAPVRLECAKPLSENVHKTLLMRLGLQKHQVFVTSVPLDLSYTWGLGSNVSEEVRAGLVNPPFNPEWPACFDKNRSILKQVPEKEVLLSYPYESMDPFVQMLREASEDPNVISISITLYRLATVSRLAEALIKAAENGKQVNALFELRARFDESNNIEWSQRFEEAGCNVIYGFRDYKVHSKICCITRQTDEGLQYITQLGTGNYNEKTARLYTDFSFITTDASIGEDATEFFRNMSLENASDDYKTLWVAPLQIKQNIIDGIDQEIKRSKAGLPCGLLFKTNSITDRQIIEKIAEASQAGVPCTLFVRGISCIVPGVKGFTENVRVVSIVGRLLEHSRIYVFGPLDDPQSRIYLSSADLMTRNMEKRVEIAWPINAADLHQQVVDYLQNSLADTAKLRQLQEDGTYTELGAFVKPDENGQAEPFDSQAFHINQAQNRAVIQAVLQEEKAHAKAVAKAAKKRAKAEEKAQVFAEAKLELEADLIAQLKEQIAAELKDAIRAEMAASGQDQQANDAPSSTPAENAPAAQQQQAEPAPAAPATAPSATANAQPQANRAAAPVAKRTQSKANPLSRIFKRITRR